MSDQKTSVSGPLAVVAVLTALCCGLPLFGSIGVLGAIAGIGTGNWFVVAFAAAVTAVGFVWWRRTNKTRPLRGADDLSNPVQRDAVLSPTGIHRSEEKPS